MRGLVILAALAAAGVPLTPEPNPPPPAPAVWPSRWEGHALTPLPATALDAKLGSAFPGRIARFSDGKRQIILRQVTAATRQLHPARDCFRAIGYTIEQAPMRVDASGDSWSCFDAQRHGAASRVCEQIRDAAGARFSDATAWYWPALLGTSPGPWLAVTTVERVH